MFAEKDLRRQSIHSIKKGIKSLNDRIEEHKRKIEHPEELPYWGRLSDYEKRYNKEHWKNEIEEFKISIKNREEEIKRRIDDE